MPIKTAVHKPVGVSYEDAAVLPVAGAVAYDADFSPPA
jgi:hypothetical protein